MLRCTYLRPGCAAASPPQVAIAGEAAILEFKLDASSVTRIRDELAKDSGPLDSSFAPISQQV
jgi:hypothetical protein